MTANTQNHKPATFNLGERGGASERDAPPACMKCGTLPSAARKGRQLLAEVNGHGAVVVRQHPAAVERDGWHTGSPHASGSAQVAAGRSDPGDGDLRHLVASGCHRHHCRRAGCGQNKWFQLHMACRSWRPLAAGTLGRLTGHHIYIVGRGSCAPAAHTCPSSSCQLPACQWDVHVQLSVCTMDGHAHGVLPA